MDPDAPPDTDSGSVGWTEIDGFPELCDQWTTDPALIGRFEETGCDEMPVGCTRLVPSWPDGRDLYLVSRRTGIHDGTRGLFTALHYISDSQIALGVFTEEGNPQVAFRGRLPTEVSGCQVARLMAGRRGDVAFKANVLDAPTRQFVGAASEETGGEPQLIHIVEEEDARLSGIGTLWPTQGGVAINLTPASFMLLLDWTDGTPTPIGSPDGDPGLDTMSDFYDSAIFFTYWDETQEVRVALPGDENRTLIAPSDAAAAATATVRTDGTSLYWLQGYGQTGPNDFERIEIWSAPYTTDPSALVPRRVAVTPLTAMSNTLHAGHEYAAIGQPESRLQLYRVADGAEATIDPPPGTILAQGGVLWLGPEEIAIAYGPRAALDGLRYTTHVWRIRYDALTWE
jgi:hypothetical protein